MTSREAPIMMFARSPGRKRESTTARTRHYGSEFVSLDTFPNPRPRFCGRWNRTKYGYDEAEYLSSISHAKDAQTLASASYVRDARGNVSHITYQDGSWQHYGYDDADQIIFERYVNAAEGTDERFYYEYSESGNRTKSSGPAAVDQNWADEFDRADVGADYASSGGSWSIADDGGTKYLERSNTVDATGPAMITNTAQLKGGYVQVRGAFKPLGGTAEKPLRAALVFGYADADNYWLAGADCWMAIPDGEANEKLHLQYFVAQVSSGAFTFIDRALVPEVLPLGVESFELSLEVQRTVLELARSFGGGESQLKLAPESPWKWGTMPASRIGFYTDRQPVEPADPPDPLEPAGCRFDFLKLDWTEVAQATVEYTYNSDQQLTTVTGAGRNESYEYDEEGNCVRMERNGTVYTFEYNYENRVTRVLRDDVEIRSYSYQGDEWMPRSSVEDGIERRYLYDGQDLLAQFNAGGELLTHSIGNGLDNAGWISRRNGLGDYDTHTPLADARSTMAVADATGALTSRYRYRAFGKRFTTSGGNPARRDPTFQQRTYDEGLGIYDYRNRSFDPATGRFLQRDPVLDGNNRYNPYAAMGNNPVGNVDPMGTRWVKVKGKWTWVPDEGEGKTPPAWQPKPSAQAMSLAEYFATDTKVTERTLRRNLYLNPSEAAMLVGLFGKRPFTKKREIARYRSIMSKCVFDWQKTKWNKKLDELLQDPVEMQKQIWRDNVRLAKIKVMLLKNKCAAMYAKVFGPTVTLLGLAESIPFLIGSGISSAVRNDIRGALRTVMRGGSPLTKGQQRELARALSQQARFFRDMKSMGTKGSRAWKLAWDPAIKGLRTAEAKAALEFEVHFGTTLQRSSKGAVDFIGTEGKFAGKTLDVQGATLKPQHFKLEGPKGFKQSVLGHLPKSDYTVLYLRALTKKQYSGVQAFLKSLSPAQRSKILVLR